jgi:hypothetical protein
MRAVTVVAALVLCLAVPAQGALAPSKASQLVTLVSGAACSCFGGTGVVLDTRVNADGRTAPFSIPAKQVLVLDAWRWDEVFPGPVAAVFLCLGSSPGSTVWTASTTTTASVAFFDAALPAIPVRSGAAICAASYGATPDVEVHGFLAPDR